MGEVRDPRTYAVIGAAMEVHRELGCGFLEAVYQEALALELTMRGVPFTRERHVPVSYKGARLATPYRADFVCYDAVLVEVKALKALSGTEESQVLNYLKATSLQVGLMLNFGKPSLEYKRYALSATPSHSPSAKSASSADSSAFP